MTHNDLTKFCIAVSQTSTKYELLNNELKKEYIKKSVEAINIIMRQVDGYKGSFGTGYPFYTLGEGFEGNLPIIEEQLNYNNLLISEAIKSKQEKWVCEDCLELNSDKMKDLKINCKPCPRIEDSLKPRKIINRLPDIDIWMVCDDDKLNEAQQMLANLFIENNIEPSDNDVIGTIEKCKKIVEELYEGKMPSQILPIDVHIIKYSELENLIKMSPEKIVQDMENGFNPYLPINPISWRKTWQHDDEAYNFIFDFLYSMTPYDFDKNLLGELIQSRNVIAETFTIDQLTDILMSISSDAVIRRFESAPLVRTYKKRVAKWKI